MFWPKIYQADHFRPEQIIFTKIFLSTKTTHTTILHPATRNSKKKGPL